MAPVANWRRASSRRQAQGARPTRRWQSDGAKVPASGVGDVVTSQGQRFRRRALRRGYKVDEVDSFLDRVEATIAGDSVGAPVSAQEVHDVVFRVRFGGYDEWQVDLHLDRVERQLSELEERGGFPRMPDRSGMEPPRSDMRPEMRSGEMRMVPPERMVPDRMMPERLPPDRVGPDRIAPDRMPMGGPPDR